jgi:hypothetical protein
MTSELHKFFKKINMQLITVEEVKSRLDNGEKLNLLDVRQPSENAEFNIGGVLFPLGKVQAMDISEIEELKDQEVICYCRILPAACWRGAKNSRIDLNAV